MQSNFFINTPNFQEKYYFTTKKEDFIDKNEIYSLAREIGFDDCGFAEIGEIDEIYRRHFDNWIENGYNANMQWIERKVDIRFNPKLLLEDAKTVVVVLLSHNLETTPYPKIARYALGEDYHKKIKTKLNILAEKINANTKICVDTAPILEKYWAQKAGLGFIGRNTLFISPKLGSFCNIGILLLDIDLNIEAKNPPKNVCENCNKCINSCPTKALVAPFTLDCNKCISYQNQHKSDPDFDYFGWDLGCDICQEVCPFNLV